MRGEDFERFVFTMSVLEHYSEHDCALLLGRSVPEVREARTRALHALMDSNHMVASHNQVFMQEKRK